jgi:RNA polymerase sigma factor (sigma-70 family)
VTTDTHVEDQLRRLAPQVLGALVRRYGHFDASEDAVQEALLAASTQWPEQGVPDNPRGWLITVASRRLTDQLRSEEARQRREDTAALMLPHRFSAPPGEEQAPDKDDTLTLLFLCCHPALSSASQIALTLRAVGGLTTQEIARAFLVPEATMAQRISRAKQSIKASDISFEMPPENERAERLDSVLHVLYLIFNEGYTTSSGPELQRAELTAEAIRLTRDLHQLLPDNGEVAALLALMLLTDARRAARSRPDGSLVPMAEQDRSLWDQAAIEEGIALVTDALSRPPVGLYKLQAAIAAVHAEAKRAEDTDWPQIVALYAVLERVAPNPMVTLSHAVALAMAQGPQAGLDMLESLHADDRLARHHRLDAVRAHLQEMAGDYAAARASYRIAARRTTSIPEQRYLEGQAARLADMTAADLAERSGASVEYVRRLIDLGIVSGGDSDHPYSVPDIQRVRLARALDRSGIPLEAIGKAVSSGDLSFNFVDALFPDPPALGAKTVRAIASDLGLSLDTVSRLYAMWGLPRPEPDEAIREDEAAVFTEWAASLPPQSLTRDVFVHGARVLGETARRIADFAFDSFRTRVEAPMLASDTVLQQVMDTTGAFSQTATASLQRQFAWLVQRQLEHHTTQFVVEYVETAIESAGGASPKATSPPAMVFLDLTGYTALTEELGDEAAAEHATLLASTVQEVAHSRGGQVVKLLGDGAMFYFTTAAAAALAGLELVERVEASGLPPARVGVAAGPVVFREGDCFGRTVNIAARVMDRAKPRQVLVTPEVVEATGSTGVRFEDVGEFTLKGVSEPVKLAVASRTP